MKNIKSLLNKKSNIRLFSKGYFRYVTHLMENLDINAIAAFIKELEKARKNKNTVFFIGNGGSAATASHMVNDISLGSREYSDDVPFRTIALTDNLAVLTAVANDCGYANIFIKQLKILYRPGDKLVAISVSGNSSNVIAAAEWVKEKGGVVIGMVGFDGGQLKNICDLVIHAKTTKGEYGPAEDIHSMLGHLVHTWLWYGKRNQLKI